MITAREVFYILRFAAFGRATAEILKNWSVSLDGKRKYREDLIPELETCATSAAEYRIILKARELDIHLD